MAFDLDDEEYKATRKLTGADKPDEIKVGEYVRTRNGEIGIFKGYNANKKSQWKLRIKFEGVKTWKYCAEEYIVKHKPKPIDLIEVDDYVNGLKVYAILKDVVEVITNTGSAIYISNDSIKSIVTKEQYKSVEYVIQGR